MNRLYKLMLAGVIIAGCPSAWAACEAGSAHERVACLQQAFCPNPASAEERVACFEMITAALRGEEQSAPATAEPAAPPAPAREIRSSAPGPAAPVESAPASVVVAPAEPPPEPAARVAEAPARGEPAEERGAPTILSRVTGVARRFEYTEDEEIEPGWSKVVFVRSEAGGTELVVLDNGQVWAEKKRNPYFKINMNDVVRVTPEGTLIRKTGGRTKVEALDCSKRPRVSRCRALADHL